MTDKPTALRLAAQLEDTESARLHLLPYAAAELRRLHEANEKFGKRQEWWNERMFALEKQRDELLEALHCISLASKDSGSTREGMGLYARAAIAKVEGKPLYLHPAPQRQPLTDEQIRELSQQHKFDSRMEKFVRIIERAHGIGGKE